MLIRQIIISSQPRKNYFCNDTILSVLDVLMFQVWFNIKNKNLPSQWTQCAPDWKQDNSELQPSVMQRQRTKSAFHTARSFHLTQDKLSTGSVFFDHPIHAGAVCDVGHGIAAEVAHAAVPWLFVQPVGTTVPGVVRQPGHAAVR